MSSSDEVEISVLSAMFLELDVAFSAASIMPLIDSREKNLSTMVIGYDN